MNIRKIISSAIAAAMTFGISAALPQNITAEAASDINYAEALQKSLYFYECQQAGNLPEWNRVEWRADSNTDDFIDGGWYDAGDHVKFNLPMAYSASMLAWGLYEYGDGVEKVGQYEIYQNNLEFVLDYLAACDLGDEIVFQVGNGTEDHTWWGPVELYAYGMGESSPYTRPYYSASSGCSAVFGEMAAALAAGAAALEGKSDKTDNYIEHAKHIFEIASTSPSDEEYNNSDASGFYRSSHFYDELFYAANWLYIATGEKEYLDKAASYIPQLGKELGSDELKYSWGHCWDDVQQGGMLLYARSTGDSKYIERVKKHLDYWNTSVEQLDGGLRWLTTWGCLRYAETAAFLAAVASDTLLTGSDASKYKDFYETQINFALGDNPDNFSYEVGYGESYPINTHHRTAHASWKNDIYEPVQNRHILYGALVGGPNQDGTYEDDRNNYINNEVATDYNAGFTAILCKMVSEYGGTPDPDFPQPEIKDDEFYVEAMIKTDSASGTTLSLKFTNHTAWPARVIDNMSFRYYMDLSEVIKAGYSADDIVVRVDRDQSAMYSEVTPAVVSKIQQYDGDIYYIEVTYPDGRAAMPISTGRCQCETMLALVYPDYGSGWDSSNDPSIKGLNEDEGVVAQYIPVYENGTIIFGTEPDGTTGKGSTSASNSGNTGGNNDKPTAVKGDVNSDSKVNIQDLLMMKKYLLGMTTLSSQGLKNADMNENDTVNIIDAVLLAREVLK
ncbi:MAG: glycoside hydrolase family 9 protein [Oscillospiraceae bacterium]